MTDEQADKIISLLERIAAAVEDPSLRDLNPLHRAMRQAYDRQIQASGSIPVPLK